MNAAEKLSDDVAELCRTMPRRGSANLRGQMERAADSVVDNIAEGAGRGQRGEKLQAFRYARGSLEEVQSQLKRCRKRNLVDEPTFHRLWSLTVTIGKMLGSLIAKLERAAALVPARTS